MREGSKDWALNLDIFLCNSCKNNRFNENGIMQLGDNFILKPQSHFFLHGTD